MSRSRESIEEEIATLEDNIACAEHDEEMDGSTSYDIDGARCRLHDLRELLREMDSGK